MTSARRPVGGRQDDSGLKLQWRARKKRSSRSLLSPLRARVSFIVLIILVVGAGYAMMAGWLFYRDAQHKAADDQSLVETAMRTDATPAQRQAAEGKDENKAADALAHYRVAASLPRAIYADAINVKARILPMSLNPDGSVQAPINIFDAGWYSGSAKPGQKGAAMIVGHASGPTRQGLFAYLDTLKKGDTINVERGDGTILRYEVVQTKTVPVKAVDMNEMLVTHGGDEGLNLMTCSGVWLSHERTFDHRVMVFTKRIE